MKKEVSAQDELNTMGFILEVIQNRLKSLDVKSVTPTVSAQAECVEKNLTPKEDRNMSELEAKKDTTKQPAGDDSVVLLGKKFEELMKKMEEMGKKQEAFGITVEDIGKMLKMPDYKQYQNGPAVKSEKREEEEESKKKTCKEEEEEDEEEEESPKKKEAKKKTKAPPADADDGDDGDDDAPAASSKPKGARVEGSDDANELEGISHTFDNAWEEVYEAAQKEIGAFRRKK